jgi:hypothetical protein
MGRGELTGTGGLIGRGALIGAGGVIGRGPLKGDRGGTGRSGLKKGMVTLGARRSSGGGKRRCLIGSALLRCANVRT